MGKSRNGGSEPGGRCVHIAGVTGSSPVSPTNKNNDLGGKCTARLVACVPVLIVIGIIAALLLDDEPARPFSAPWMPSMGRKAVRPPEIFNQVFDGLNTPILFDVPLAV